MALERTLAVQARLDALRSVGLWLAQAARDEGLPYEVAFGLDLAVHEAVENVVRHGCADGAEHTVHLTIRSDSQRVEVEIQDDGTAFDPLSVTPRARPESLAEVIPGGHGVQLMRYFCDEVSYRRQHDRNVLRLVRFRSSPAGRAH